MKTPPQHSWRMSVIVIRYISRPQTPNLKCVFTLYYPDFDDFWNTKQTREWYGEEDILSQPIVGLQESHKMPQKTDLEPSNFKIWPTAQALYWFLLFILLLNAKYKVMQMNRINVVEPYILRERTSKSRLTHITKQYTLYGSMYNVIQISKIGLSH